MNSIITSITKIILRYYYYIMAAFMCMMAVFVFFAGGRILMLALVWNMFLALVPVIITDIMKKMRYKGPKALALLIWLVFLPNAFYMLTDIMHIQFLALETSSSAYVVNGYSRDIVEWMTFFTILSMGIYGFLLGCHSVVDMTSIIKPIHHCVFYAVISFLSAIGIYIGRFLRFNTWDLIHPRSLLRTVLASADRFTVMFVVVMSVIIYTGIIRYAQTHLQTNRYNKS